MIDNNMFNIETIGILIGIITGGAAILYGIIYSIYYAYRGIKKVSRVVHIIEKELLPTNGGSSMRDAIKRLELMAHSENSRFKTWMTFFPNPVFETNSNGYCVYVNRAYLTLTGSNINDVLGTGWITNIHPEDRELVHQEWEASVKDKREYCLTYRLLDKDNNSLMVHAHACPSFDNDRQVIGYIGILSILNNKSMKPYCTKTRLVVQENDIPNED